MTTGPKGPNKTGGTIDVPVLQPATAALPVVEKGLAAPHQTLAVTTASDSHLVTPATGLRSSSGVFNPPSIAVADDDVKSFRALIHELEKGSLDDVVLQDTVKNLREFWESRPDLVGEPGQSQWQQFLRRPQGLRFAKAYLKFTNRILTDKPNAKGILVNSHEKLNCLIPLLRHLKDQSLLHKAQELVTDIFVQIPDFYLHRTPGQKLIKPELLVAPEHSKTYRFNLAAELFWYSRGNPEIENQFLHELADIAGSPIQEMRTALADVFRRLALLTKKDRFSADDALTVRDFADLLGRSNPMPLLANSTSFPSDAWSSVSARGFLKRAREQKNWEGKDVLEIGSGKGILSLLLAEETEARSIDGVDINPDSPHIGRINTLLRVAAGANANLWDRLAFYQTDDLDAGAPAGKQYDVAVGCIPQSPSTSEKISDRERADVYPASDYPEDIDGLGLLSKALQRALRINRIKPGGEYLLTVSGRPALESVVKMANLRGWVATPVEEADILQHKGTDLSRYAEIEKMGVRLPFEFWVEGKKINATEAKRRIDEYNTKYLEASVTERRLLESDPVYQVSHKLYVISFKPLRDFETQIKQAAASKVAQEIETAKGLRYFNETGTEYEKFGLALADYLTSITSIKIPREMLFITTGLNRLIYNYAYTTTQAGKKVFVDPQLQISPALAGNLRNRWDVNSNFADDVVLVVSGLKDKTRNELETWLIRAEERKQPLLLVANHESVNELGFVTQWMLEHPGVAPYVAISWQNTHLPLEAEPLASLVLPNKKIYEAMQHLGKDTYSRVSLRALYEAGLLGELKALSGIQGDFSKLPRQMPGDFETLGVVEGAAGDVSLQAHQLRTFPAHPPRLDEPGVIDLSFGESEFEVPQDLLEQMTESLNTPVSESDVRAKITDYLLTRQANLQGVDISLVLGAGVHPLIQQTLQNLANGQVPKGSVLMPLGHYGQFPSTLHTAGLAKSILKIPASQKMGEDILKKLEDQFDASIRQGRRLSAILINYPVNPSGLYYSADTLKGIIQFAKSHDLLLLADEVFYETGSLKDRTSVLDFMNDPDCADFLKQKLVVFGGISKDMGWGMARFGYAYSPNKNLIADLESKLLDQVDPHALKLANLAYTPDFREAYLSRHLEWLEAAREKVKSVLQPFLDKKMIYYQNPEGGYFIELDISRLFGQKLTHEGSEIKIDDDGANLRQILHDHFGLKISPVGWAGNSSTIRLVYSVKHLDVALKRLENFLGSFPEKLPKLKLAVQQSVVARLEVKSEQVVFVEAWPEELEKGKIYFKLSHSDDLQPGQILARWEPVNPYDGTLPIEIYDSEGKRRTANYLAYNTDIKAIIVLATLKKQNIVDSIQASGITLEFTRIASPTAQSFMVDTSEPETKLPEPLFEGFNETAFKAAVSSRDGKLGIKSLMVFRQSAGAPGKVQFGLYHEGNPVGEVSFIFKTNEEGWVSIRDVTLELQSKGQNYGIEIIGNFVAYLRSLPMVKNISYQAVHQGRYAWRYLDGFKLDNQTLSSVRKTLRTWANQFGWRIDKADLRSADTAYQLGKLIDMGGPFPLLIPAAIEGYEDSERPLAQKIVRSRFPGEVALLLQEVKRGRKAYDASLDLCDEGRYAAFLDSLIEFWQKRLGQTPRAEAILANLKSDRALVLAPSRETLVIRPKWGTDFAKDLREIKSDWPSFLDADEFKASIQTADGNIKIGDILSRFNELSGHYNVVMDFKDQDGAHIGALTLNYVPDKEREGFWIVKDSFIHIVPKYRNQKYGIELRTKVIRHHYGLPHVSGWQIPITQDGLLLWRHLNGLEISDSFINKIRDELKRLNNEYHIFSDESINRAHSSWDFANLFTLSAPHEGLAIDASQVLPDHHVSTYDDLVEKTANVGEIAMWRVVKEAEKSKRPVMAFLDLTKGNESYRKFLESLKDYWTYRKVVVERGPQILSDIQAELAAFDQAHPNVTGLPTQLSEKPSTRSYERVLQPQKNAPIRTPRNSANAAPQPSPGGGDKSPDEGSAKALLTGAIFGGIHPAFDGNAALDLSTQVFTEPQVAANSDAENKPDLHLVPDANDEINEGDSLETEADKPEEIVASEESALAVNSVPSIMGGMAFVGQGPLHNVLNPVLH